MDNCNIDRKLDERAEALFARISLLIETARKNIASTVNITMVYANFETGKYIVRMNNRGRIGLNMGNLFRNSYLKN